MDNKKLTGYLTILFDLIDGNNDLKKLSDIDQRTVLNCAGKMIDERLQAEMTAQSTSIILKNLVQGK